jgi:septum formation protein
MDFSSNAEYAVETARRKVLDIRSKLEEKGEERPELIIGADTIVVLDGRVFGKPEEERRAVEMLRE